MAPKKQDKSKKATDLVKATQSSSKNLPVNLDPLSIYMREASKFPLLTKDEERQLALKVYEKQDKLAAQKLAQANLRFVMKIAFDYAKYGSKLMDLIQEGNLGLVKAIKEFNPYKEVRLTTYAVWWIRSYIQDYLLKNWSVVKIGTTKAQKKLFYRLKQIQNNYEKMGITPHPKAIAHTLNVKVSDVELMQKRLASKDTSLNTPIQNDGNKTQSFEDFLEDKDVTQTDILLSEAENKNQFQLAIEEFKDDLTERELDILDNRLLAEKPQTLLEIGKKYGFSKERARQIEEKIKNKLKSFLSEHYPDISIN